MNTPHFDPTEVDLRNFYQFVFDSEMVKNDFKELWFYAC